MVPAFLEAAKELLETSGLSAEVLLAKALAKTAVCLTKIFPCNIFFLFLSKQVLTSSDHYRASLR